MYKKIKVFILLALLLIGSLNLTSSIKANTDNNGFIDKIEITNQGDLHTDSLIQAKLYYHLNNHKKGDVIKIKLPAELRISNAFSFPLLTRGGVEVGIVNVDKNGEATIKLTDPTDYLASHEQVQGVMYINTYLNNNLINKPGKYPLPFQDSDGSIENVNVQIKPNPNVKPPKDQLLVKWGYLKDDNTIHWRIRINFAQKELKKVKLEERVGPGQVILDNSIRLYRGTFDEFGNISNQNNVLDEYNYEVVDGNQLDIYLGDINTGYFLEFDTMITDSNMASFTNDVYLKGEQVTISNDHGEVAYSYGNGVIGGYGLHDLVIKKVDGDTNEPLQGVHFKLCDENHNTLYDDIVTDEKGMAIIKNLHSGVYYLHETKPLPGYAPLKKPIKIVLTQNNLEEVQNFLIQFPPAEPDEKPEKPEVKPEEPSIPTDPENPIIPIKPEDPVKPVDPVIPTEPIISEKPVNPVEPVDPGKAEDDMVDGVKYPVDDSQIDEVVNDPNYVNTGTQNYKMGLYLLMLISILFIRKVL